MPQLINDAQHGKTVWIVGENEQAVQLVPVALEQKQREPGSACGLVKMVDDFDVPLTDFDEYLA